MGKILPKRVYAWGAGEDGQLGLGTRHDESTLQPITALDGLEVSSVVAGSRNSLAICANGDVYVWGWNQRGTLGHPPDTVAKSESKPSQVKALAGIRVVQAAIGGWHCLAVDEQGQVYAWGGNEYGQCAIKSGKVTRRDIPVPLHIATHLKARQVAAGGTHSVVLTDSGEVWTWGQPWPPGDIQQIWRPVRVAGLKNVRGVAVGAFHNLALLESGQVWAWGNNEYGQLGTGDTQPRAQPVEIRELANIVDIAAGGWHSMALTAKGEVWAWGRGEHGRLGFGEDKSSKMVPHPVPLLASTTIVQVSCGGTHSVALAENGRMFAFGRGDNGRLGNGRTITDGHPSDIPLPFQDEQQSDTTSRSSGGEASPAKRVVFVACGGRHTLALASTRDPLSECTALLPWRSFQRSGAKQAASEAASLDTPSPEPSNSPPVAESVGERQGGSSQRLKESVASEAPSPAPPVVDSVGERVNDGFHGRAPAASSEELSPAAPETGSAEGRRGDGSLQGTLAPGAVSTDPSPPPPMAASVEDHRGDSSLQGRASAAFSEEPSLAPPVVICTPAESPPVPPSAAAAVGSQNGQGERTCVGEESADKGRKVAESSCSSTDSAEQRLPDKSQVVERKSTEVAEAPTGRGTDVVGEEEAAVVPKVTSTATATSSSGQKGSTKGVAKTKKQRGAKSAKKDNGSSTGAATRQPSGGASTIPEAPTALGLSAASAAGSLSGREQSSTEGSKGSQDSAVQNSSSNSSSSSVKGAGEKKHDDLLALHMKALGSAS
eukprot:TRINITY_DN1234_c0_g2_i1.p1 TRINITY_DN1234_c0_g2~~TRINITY_DN1234_c0_g2_i1.p1  ORF type:complete len:774 (+),score=158.02 TRINITY_DN1234_c0_g2_i1:215-2536(+)